MSHNVPHKCCPAPSVIITADTIALYPEQVYQQGWPVRESLLTRYDLYTADECFMTGSGAEIVPVVQIDGRCIGSGKPGPMTADLRQRFAARCCCEGVKAI